MKYYPLGKRFLDVLLCLLVTPLVLPMGLFIAFVSAVVFKQQIIYSHLRPGLKAKPFVFYKFSTLLPEEERNGIVLSDGERQNAWGKFLRDYSLDELPQILNILKGDMSWVGPRPLLMEYLPLYSPQEARRHLVKPGLTGLAQVNGRNEISWDEKMFYDQQYVAQPGFLLDMHIITKTIVSVWAGQRINFGSKPRQATIKSCSSAASPSSLSTDKAF